MTLSIVQASYIVFLYLFLCCSYMLKLGENIGGLGNSICTTRWVWEGDSFLLGRYTVVRGSRRWETVEICDYKSNLW